MTQLSFPLPTIGQPDKFEDPKIVTGFTEIINWANGQIDLENLSATLQAKVEGRRSVIQEVNSYAPAGTTGFNFFSQSGSLFIKNGGSNTGGGQRLLYLNPSDYGPSGPGELRLRATSITNEISPSAAGECHVALAIVANAGGSAGTLLTTLGTTVSGSEVLLPLSKGTFATAVSSGFVFPAPGLYAIYIGMTGTVPANGLIGIDAALSGRV